MAKLALTHATRPHERISAIANKEFSHRAETSEGESARRLLEESGYPAKNGKARNGQYEFCCPFHEEPGEVVRNKSANFYLDADTSKYYCHSAKCGERGNLQTLERFFGVAPEEQSHFETKEAKLKRYEANLTPERRRPFYEHGLNDTTIERFRLGYDPERSCWVIPYLDGRRPLLFRFYDPTCTVGPGGSKYWWEEGSKARLFNANDAVGDVKHRVFLAEGEQKAMLLCQLGYAAVATPGAGMFKDDWFGAFNQAREIYIVFDNDNPEHPDNIRENCRICEGDCDGHNPGQDAAVKLKEAFDFRGKNILLPLPKEFVGKTDINDYFTRDGRTSSDFAELALGEKKAPFIVPSFAEIMENPPEESTFLVEQGILPQGGRLLIAGRPKVGKSIFAENLALSLCSGLKFLGRYKVDHPTRVLLLDRELSKRSLYDRIMALMTYRPGYRAAAENLCIDHDHLLKWDQPGAYDKLCELVTQNGAEVIIFDTAYKFLTGDMEKSGRMAAAFDVLDRLIHETGVSIVITHHHRKGAADSKGKDIADSESVAGSFLWTGWPNATVLLNYLERSVINPFNAACTFTAFRDAPPPEPLAIYRDRHSLAYTAITDYSHDDEPEGAKPSTETRKPTEREVADLLLDMTPCTEDDFMHAACNYFGVRYATVRPYFVMAMNTGYFTKTDGRPPIIKYALGKEEETWEEEHHQQLRLVGGNDDV